MQVSDSNASFIDQARQRLDNWFAAKWWKARFTFSVTRAEKADELVAKGSVDLVTLMQCAHWTDQDAMVKSIASSYTPNGTLLVVQINPVLNIIGNGAVKEAVDRLFEFWGRNILEARGGKNSLMGTSYLPQGNAGVECVPLPEAVFIQDATKRGSISMCRNEAQRRTRFQDKKGLVAPSRADSQHRRYEYTNNEAEGTGWRYEVGSNWFRGLIGTVEQKSRLHLYEGHLREVERLLKETSAIGIVEIEWTVSLLLATQK